MKIVSIGEITYDEYFRQNRFFVGGISLNFAVNAKRCGADVVSLISCVGSDEAGRVVVDTLAKEGVDHSQVAVMDGKTAICGIDVYANGERHFPPGTYHVNILDQFRVTQTHRVFIVDHDILVTYYDGFGNGSVVQQVMALETGDMKRVVDFGDWSDGKYKADAVGHFESLDIAFLSGDAETVKKMRPIAASLPCLIVVTLGAQGSCVLQGDRLFEQEALPVEQVVDTTGCGDAFQAAFSVSYFTEGDVRLALLAGAKQAATVAGHFGAFSQPQ